MKNYGEVEDTMASLEKKLGEVNEEMQAIQRSLDYVRGIPSDEERESYEKYQEEEIENSKSPEERIQEERENEEKNLVRAYNSFNLLKQELSYKIKVKDREEKNDKYNYSVSLTEEKGNEENIDMLERNLLAIQIVKEIKFSHSDVLLNVGVLGRWGQGKSFFMQLMKDELEKCADTMVCVEFDAAAYDTKDKMWANLAQKLFAEYEKKCGYLKYNF